jgi:hypothetical protein
MHMTTTQNNFTQVLYSMNHKSIISLISFFLLSMFYVASANAGPTYVNIKIPKVCGAWKYNASRSQHCAGTGNGNDVPAGTKGTFRCVGGVNGVRYLSIEMANCNEVTWRTRYQPNDRRKFHWVQILAGRATCSDCDKGLPWRNTKNWRLLPSKPKECWRGIYRRNGGWGGSCGR